MIGSHVVSPRDFALLSAGGGDHGTIEALLAGQFSRRMVLLQAVRESARQASLKALASLDTAYTLLADVQHERPDVIRTVLTLPCVGLWAAACLRDGGDHTHRYLSSLAATAALRANRGFEIEVPVWDGMVYLPTLGSVSLRTPGGRTARIQSRGNGDAVVVAGGEPLRIPFGDKPTAPGWRPVRHLRVSAQGRELRVWLEDAGPFRGPAGLLASPLPQDRVTRWEHVLHSAWQLLVRRHPEHAEAISAGLRVLTPMTSRSEGVSASMTAADAFGAVLLTPPSDAESLALTLLHESQHGKLAALHHLLPLYTNDSRARWYARWRDDPRPLNALLHGAYAHLGVAGFWHEAMRSGGAPLRSMAAEELAYCCNAVDEALGQLSSSGALTHAGTRFIAGMASTLAQLGSARIPGAPRRRAVDRGICDRMTWRMRHLRPDPAVTDRYAHAWLTESKPAVAPEMTAVTLCAGERGALGSTRLLQARRTTRDGPEDGLGPTAADIDYAQGRHEQALAGYKRELTRNPGDPGGWAGLALVLRDGNSRKAASFLADYPELARAIALRIRALSGRSADPVALIQWIADLGTEPSVR